MAAAALPAGGMAAATAAAAAMSRATSAAPTSSTSTSTPTPSAAVPAATPGLVTVPPVRKASGWVHFVAGGCGGMLGALVTCPLEVVKTRLQSSNYSAELQRATAPGPSAAAAAALHGPPGPSAQPPSLFARQFGSVPTIMYNIYKQEGVFALWRGLGPNLAGIVPSRAIYFFAYSSCKDTLVRWRQKENWQIHMTAAGAATVAVATTTAPLWMIKTRMQLQTSGSSAGGFSFPVYRNSWHCFTEVVRKEGVLALYRGLSASYLGGFETAIQFVIYEQLKSMRAPVHAERAGQFSNVQRWMDLLLMAASSKLVASILTYPHEVIRTRLREPVGADGQRKYTGIRQAVVRIAAEEGVGALYGGLGAHLLRVVPNAAIMFFGYEAIVHYFAR